MGWVPVAPPPAAKDPGSLARRAVAEAKLAKAQRKQRKQLEREPWRDPASDHYDPLRVLRERDR